jgi:hypothetical protein
VSEIFFPIIVMGGAMLLFGVSLVAFQMLLPGPYLGDMQLKLARYLMRLALADKARAAVMAETLMKSHVYISARVAELEMEDK